MEELLIFILQVIFEILGNVMLRMLFDLMLRMLFDLLSYIFDSRIYDWMMTEWAPGQPQKLSFAGIFFLNLLAGAALGFVSLGIYHTTFAHSSHARLLALCLAPLLSGLFSYRIAEYRKKAEVIPRHHFWWAFAFTFGFSVVRFTFCHRP